MATYRIVPLSKIVTGGKYRLITAPSLAWSRSFGIVHAHRRGDQFICEPVTMTAKTIKTNVAMNVREYGKTWGLQKVD